MDDIVKENSSFETSSDFPEQLNISRWKLDDDIHGPVVAFFVSVEFVTSCFISLFILYQAIWKFKDTFRKSSNIFFFSFVLSNFIMVLLYMPFYIVATGAGEWIFGSSDRTRSTVCKLQGTIYLFGMGHIMDCLAAISVDRFLTIVMFDFHKKYMTWKVAHGITIFTWVYNLIFILIITYVFPDLGISLVWVPILGTCIIDLATGGWISYLPLVLLIPLLIIIVTTSATFVYTRFILRKNLKRHQKTLNERNLDMQKSIYNDRIKNLIGIFGLLILFNIAFILPFIVGVILAVTIGVNKIPSNLAVTGFVMNLSDLVMNLIIQVYFIKYVRDKVKLKFHKISAKIIVEDTQIMEVQYDFKLKCCHAAGISV